MEAARGHAYVFNSERVRNDSSLSASSDGSGSGIGVDPHSFVNPTTGVSSAESASSSCRNISFNGSPHSASPQGSCLRLPVPEGRPSMSAVPEV